MDIMPSKQSRCVSPQGSSGMNTNPIPCRMFSNTERLLCVWKVGTTIKDKTANGQLLSFDAGCTGTGESGSEKGRELPRLFLQPGFPLLGLEGKNRNLRNICFGRDGLFPIFSKGNAMKSKFEDVKLFHRILGCGSLPGIFKG